MSIFRLAWPQFLWFFLENQRGNAAKLIPKKSILNTSRWNYVSHTRYLRQWLLYTIQCRTTSKGHLRKKPHYAHSLPPDKKEHMHWTNTLALKHGRGKKAIQDLFSCFCGNRLFLVTQSHACCYMIHALKCFQLFIWTRSDKVTSFVMTAPQIYGQLTRNEEKG